MNWFKKENPVPVSAAAPDPKQQLKDLLARSQAQLHTASLAVQQAKKNVAMKQSEADVISADVRTLEHRLTEPNPSSVPEVVVRGKLSAKQAALKDLLNQVQQEQALLIQASTNYENFQKTVSQLEQQIRDLSLGVDVAHANKQRASLQDSISHGDISNGLDALKQEMQEANASAQVSDALNAPPAEDPMAAEYLKAAEGK